MLPEGKSFKYAAKACMEGTGGSAYKWSVKLVTENQGVYFKDAAPWAWMGFYQNEPHSFHAPLEGPCFSGSCISFLRGSCR